MIVLNETEVRANARQAYYDNRLQALQSPNLNGSACFYRTTTGHCCAIGASLDDETARDFDNCNGIAQHSNGSSIRDLMASKIVKSDNPGFLEDLQRAHDQMLLKSADEDNRETNHRRLRQLLDIPDRDARELPQA